MRRFSFALILVLGFTFTASAQTLWTSKDYSAPTGTLLRADFNNDGAPDLLVLSNNSTVLLNDRHGAFSGPIATGITSTHTVLLDFDSDGTTDIANCHAVYDNTTFTSADTLETWHGNGDGTFLLRDSIPLGTSGCSQLATADLNNDGHPDLVVTSSIADWNAYPNVYTNKLSVYFGNGSGFGAPVVTTGIKMTDDMSDDCGFQGNIATGDFDADGHVDLLVPTTCDVSDYTYGTLELFHGDGTGHFTHKYVIYGANNYSLKTDDINQDGRLDASAMSFGSGPHASSWSAFSGYVNNGDGTFTEKGVIGESNYAQDFDNTVDAGVFGDFNGDGIKDAIASYSDGADCCNPPTPRLAFFQGNGDGTYSAPGIIEPNEGVSIVSADFDRDGRMDFAMSKANGVLTVYLNRTSAAPACAAPASLRAVSLCPTSTSSGAHVVANTNDNRIIKAMKIYVDGASTFTTPDDVINKVLSLSAGSHKITAKAWDDLGSFSSSTTITVGSGGGGGACTSAVNRTVIVCSPASGSTVSSPVHIVAGVNDSATVTAVKIYVDGVVAYTTTSKQIDTSIAMSNGSHHITVKAWDASGSFAGSSTFTVGTTTSTCTASSTPGSITICSPAAGQTVSSPVHITAAINDSNASYSGAKAYVDGTAVASTSTRNIDTSVSLAAGLHKLTVKYWEGTTVKSTMSESFTVQ